MKWWWLKKVVESEPKNYDELKASEKKKLSWCVTRSSYADKYCDFCDRRMVELKKLTPGTLESRRHINDTKAILREVFKDSKV